MSLLMHVVRAAVLVNNGNIFCFLSDKTGVTSADDRAIDVLWNSIVFFILRDHLIRETQREILQRAFGWTEQICGGKNRLKLPARGDVVEGIRKSIINDGRANRISVHGIHVVARAANFAAAAEVEIQIARARTVGEKIRRIELEIDEGVVQHAADRAAKSAQAEWQEFVRVKKKSICSNDFSMTCSPKYCARLPLNAKSSRLRMNIALICLFMVCLLQSMKNKR